MPSHIRWIIRRDMPEVLAIEAGSFVRPWEEEDFLRVLRQRNCIGMVAERRVAGGEDLVLGYMVYELHESKLHILNLAVSPTARRQGIGTDMVRKLVSKLSHHRRNKITLEVRETNLAAQLFFQAHDFRAVRVLRGWYEDTDEDAYRMHYRLATVDDEPEEDGPVNRIAQGKLT